MVFTLLPNDPDIYHIMLHSIAAIGISYTSVTASVV
jgi:hypothetical protein